VILEDGVTVDLDLSPASGAFGVGDYWTFTARTSDGSVGPLTEAPPEGVYHHYARLAVVTFPSTYSDCRMPWPPAPTSCACTVCVEVAEYQKDPGAIAAALEQVSTLGGGRVCLGPGTFPLATNPLQITGLKNVTLGGQGPATILAYTGSGPAVMVDMCIGQRIEDLSIIALPVATASGAASQQIPIGLLVRNSLGVGITRCGIAAPSTGAQTGSPGQPAQSNATIADALGAAIVIDGLIGARFEENLLIGDLGVAAAASLIAAGKISGGSQPVPSALALAGCAVTENFMICPVAGVVLGDATRQQGSYLYFLENAIDGNTVLGGQFAGIFVEGFTNPGAAVRISRNDLEVQNVGIDARLDGVVIADNVITQADLAPSLPGGPATTGIGIAVRGVTGSKLPPFVVQVHRNRIAGIAGIGIFLDAPQATISIVDNVILATIGGGIITANFAADLLLRGNQVLGVGGVPTVGGLGIFALATDAALEDNTVGLIGNAPGQTGTVSGIFTTAVSGKITGNRIHDIGAPASASAAGTPPAPTSYGILAGAADDITVSGNIVQQASAPPPAAGNFTGIKVDESIQPPPPGPVAVCVEGNIVEGSSANSLLQISNQHPGVADCVVAGNQCHQQAQTPGPTIAIDAATAIVSNNRVGGSASIAMSVNVTRGAGANPAATIVGNIVSGDIRLQGQALPSVWAPLNIVIAPP
jgi:hypothetical protein